MVKIIEESEETPRSELLTKHSISVNNLTLTIDGEEIKIQTQGEWVGTPKILLSLFKELLGDAY